jgi:predicted DNA-binding protein (UPF0251 family)
MSPFRNLQMTLWPPFNKELGGSKMTVVTMSDTEFSRLKVLQDVMTRRLTIDEAAALLHLKRRQVFRILKAFRRGGLEALVSRRAASQVITVALRIFVNLPLPPSGNVCRFRT